MSVQKLGVLRKNTVIHTEDMTFRIEKGTIDRRLNHLKKIGSITCAGGRYQAGPEPQDRQILAAMKQFRSESFHQLTIDTIASRAGVAPKEAEPTIYALARKLDLTIGTENVKRDASAIVGDKKAESWTPRTSEQENTPSHETTQN